MTVIDRLIDALVIDPDGHTELTRMWPRSAALDASDAVGGWTADGTVVVFHGDTTGPVNPVATQLWKRLNPHGGGDLFGTVTVTGLRDRPDFPLNEYVGERDR